MERQLVSKNLTATKELKNKTPRSTFVHPDWYDNGFHRSGAGPIFTPGTTGKIRASAFPDIQKRAGLKEKGVAWHSLRHTYAYRFLTAGGSIHALSVYLGHSSIHVTETFYKQWSQTAMDRQTAGLFYKDEDARPGRIFGRDTKSPTPDITLERAG